MFKNKILLITGGTGSFGNAVLDRFLNSDIKEIRIFSRDEKKQDDMRKKYNNDKIKFYIGDVRDSQSVNSAMIGVDYVFHAAALKQVPSCEFYPLQAVKTNILGTENVLNAAVQHGVKKVICLSTDKAVYPINAMGMSKALMEKTFVAKARSISGHSSTVICGTRYGNVMASRGSVIPLFISQIEKNQPITITDPNMTRFMMSLEEAVELVIYAFKNGQNGDIFVQKSPAATIETLAEAIKQFTNSPKTEVKTIGTRHGEKLYETLLTREEMANAIELDRYYQITPDGRSLNYDKYFEEGKENISNAIEYNSHNTERLDTKQMLEMLKNLKELKRDQ
ncbi:polysaccharide biosynthesis protein [Halobacteriovorax sp.]|uniref:polysaccharide biosynthesis protein n=1 Tax=Halobacteriovorax sp. TaxID=2020862 RepID=UPI003AF2BEA0